jgi:hypothetical protein
LHSERFVLDDRRWHTEDAPSVSIVSVGAEPTGERAREQDGGGSLSDGMRAYILAYGGPVTAECTNPPPVAP